MLARRVVIQFDHYFSGTRAGPTNLAERMDAGKRVAATLHLYIDGIDGHALSRPLDDHLDLGGIGVDRPIRSLAWAPVSR